MSEAATTSAISVCGIPSRAHSQAVSREPCMTGRVSSTHTRSTLPWAWAARVPRGAVAKPAVARAPALQWVRMRAFAGTSAAPWVPRARFAAMSSSRIAWASVRSRAVTRSSGTPTDARATRRIRSSAQKRLTAVGRVAARPLIAASRSPKRASNVVARLWRAASATPKAAATPIAGAPRTTSVRIASATSSHRPYPRSSSSAGRSRGGAGCSRGGGRAPSALRVAGVLTEVGRHHAVVALERRTQVLDELAAHAPERLDLAPDLRLLAARSLHDLLAPQLGLPHVELRLAPGRGLHLVAEPLRRHERVLEGPLALGEPPPPLPERGR